MPNIIKIGKTKYHVEDDKKFEEILKFLEENSDFVIEGDEDEEDDLQIEIESTDGVHTTTKIEEEVDED